MVVEGKIVPSTPRSVWKKTILLVLLGVLAGVAIIFVVLVVMSPKNDDNPTNTSTSLATTAPAAFVDCGSADVKQEDYVGKGSNPARDFNGNLAPDGLICHNWKYVSGFEDEDGNPFNPDHNYCRNPGGKNPGAFCVAGDDYRSYLCDIPYCPCDVRNCPKDTCGSEEIKQQDYMGTISNPVWDFNGNLSAPVGLTCHNWKYTGFRDEYGQVMDHNYCRNPTMNNNEENSNGYGPGAFCVAGDNYGWYLCNVPACDSK